MLEQDKKKKKKIKDYLKDLLINLKLHHQLMTSWDYYMLLQVKASKVINI